MPKPRYDLENIIVDGPTKAQAEEQFTCPICTGLLCDPVETSCHHLFCDGCLPADQERCPVCREKLACGATKISECNKVVYRMIGALKVRCPHAAESQGEVDLVTYDSAENAGGSGAGPRAKRAKTDASDQISDRNSVC